MIRRLLDRWMPSQPMQGFFASGSTTRSRTWQVRGLRARLEVRPASNMMGRFGGGWQWAVGVKVGGTRKAGTVLVELLVGTLSVSWGKR